MSRLARTALWLFCAISAGCRGRSEVSSQPGGPLPVIPVYEIAIADDSSRVIVTEVPPAAERDPLEELGASKRVTLIANNADARTLLLWLAHEAGVNLIVAPDVTARVSVHFEEVPAIQAMRAIMAEARLSVLTSALQPNWPPVVFHQLPVNINEVSAERIVERFGVSSEMAKWIVESRPRR